MNQDTIETKSTSEAGQLERRVMLTKDEYKKKIDEVQLPIPCECLNIVLDNLAAQLETNPRYKGRTVSTLAFEHILYGVNQNREYVRTMGTSVELTLQGLKTPRYTSVKFSFCPFCGNKLNLHNAKLSRASTVLNETADGQAST
ncbi:MAG: hypothetical protein ABL933_06395 [Methyloglobulus sp.]